MKAKAARVRRSLQDLAKSSSAKAVGIASVVAKLANAETSLAMSVGSKSSVVTSSQFEEHKTKRRCIGKAGSGEQSESSASAPSAHASSAPSAHALSAHPPGCPE